VTPLGHWRWIATDSHGVEYLGDCCDGLCSPTVLQPQLRCCQVCGTVGSPPARVAGCQNLAHVEVRG
jgi:hypothetical protein